jgi:uroporphyrinogen-III decarboxylase
MSEKGKQISLGALGGKTSEMVPFGLFTWGFDYYWKVCGLEPWQLACASSEMWHKAHLGLIRRHDPDLIWYSGSGEGEKEPQLLKEDRHTWHIKDGNTQIEYILVKDSLSLKEAQTGQKNCDPLGTIECEADIDSVIPKFSGWGKPYLQGLKRLVEEVSDRALILPHHSPGYICACYALGFEKAMEMMVLNPELFRLICDKFASGDELRMRELAQAGAEAVFIADGWASCDIISPTMIEEFAIPYQRSIISAAHKAGLKVILWNEGNVLPILNLEKELELDAFAFEQSRKGIEIRVKTIRDAFGRNRCLFGNLDSELLLLRNDREEIESCVNEMIEESGKGCPFIASTGSPIPSDVSPEAIDKTIEAVRKFHY